MAVIKTRAISFLWGLAEASFFFIVPDVWLSSIVLKDKKEAYINITFALIGALLGGCVLFFTAPLYAQLLHGWLDYIPGISNSLIEKSHDQLTEIGIFEALLSGMFAGIPYKLYAYWAGVMGYSLPLFLLASAIARILRFALVTFGTQLIAKLLSPCLKLKALIIVHAICWVAFYIFYFYKVGL
ncbi:MAG: hypothetical protein CBB87_01470 [Micavibrio sp. TMED27]|nr:hypothetical protein [Micavibrio sp.]OUT92439.1 MAG: hypothetical protein CBB87_01470 [Micavibrio sp. TMED27]